MAVSDKHTPTPTEIKLHQKSRALEITYADGKTFNLPCEFLRVHSPSGPSFSLKALPAQSARNLGCGDVVARALPPDHDATRATSM